MMRSHSCGELRPSHVGQRVTLCGWVDTVRDHGGIIFIDLRDRYGTTQVVFDPPTTKERGSLAQPAAASTSSGSRARCASAPPSMVNTKLATGGIESARARNHAAEPSQDHPVPAGRREGGEGGRGPAPDLPLPRPAPPKMQHNLCAAPQDHPGRAQLPRRAVDFIEVETPILTKSTPEGARDYLVPNRVNPGTFYALPQSPQQYKQLCMVAGLDRYFQVARCFRDEDLRADRQPEFTQVDLEMSFIDARGHLCRHRRPARTSRDGRRPAAAHAAPAAHALAPRPTATASTSPTCASACC
jgi:aspartyl-tRNA synthetase